MERTPQARVLVIDDDPGIREMLSYFLPAQGYETDTADSGLAGLALLERGAYDLVVTDLGMAGMTGWEVADAVRRQGASTAVVLMTGQATGPITVHAQHRGLPLVAKPFEIERLEVAMLEALAGVGPAAGPPAAPPAR